MTAQGCNGSGISPTCGGFMGITNPLVITTPGLAGTPAMAQNQMASGMIGGRGQIECHSHPHYMIHSGAAHSFMPAVGGALGGGILSDILSGVGRAFSAGKQMYGRNKSGVNGILGAIGNAATNWK